MADIMEAQDVGYEALIVNLHTGKLTNLGAVESLRKARLRGMETAAYFALSSQNGAWHVGEALKAAGSEWENLRFVAIDVELTWVTPQQVRDAVREVTRLGARPIIYTANWFWKQHFGNSTEFRNLPLWDADYDNVERFDPFPTYGGWTERVGKQYTNEARDVKFIADGNVFDENWFLAWPKLQGFDLTTDISAFAQEAVAGRVEPVAAYTNKEIYQFTLER